MIQWCEEIGLWWPSYDKQDKTRALQFVMKRLTDSDLAVSHCRKLELCVQAGGMVGLWPKRLAKSFEQVLTFEPDAACLDALRKNVQETNVTSYGVALGSEIGTAKMRRASSAGSWRIRGDGDRKVGVVTIDSLNLSECDAIILDIEGQEISALRGASKTIERFGPVIMIEEWDPAVSEEYMRSIGYRNVERVHRDAIYVRE